jgi:hypothetical protein
MILTKSPGTKEGMCVAKEALPARLPLALEVCHAAD